MVAMAREDDNGHKITNNAIIGIVFMFIDYDGNMETIKKSDSLAI